MKKSDFKTFDIVTLCNGTKYFYFNELLIPINKVDSILSFGFYDDYLTRIFSGETPYDIMCVIRWNDECQIWNHIDDFIDKFLEKNEHYANFDVIFQRQKALELTIDDIAKKFNVSPSQIKIKK